MQVGPTPNVRACVTPAEAGLEVRHQNAWPSLEHDLLAVNDRLSFLLPPGFYYKTFIRPRRLWPLYEGVLRRAAGLGRIDVAHHPDERYDKIHRHTDVLVVGGGPAGLAAALAAADAGADVILADEQDALGGHTRWEHRAPAAPEDTIARVERHPRIEVFSSIAIASDAQSVNGMRRSMNAVLPSDLKKNRSCASWRKLSSPTQCAAESTLYRVKQNSNENRIGPPTNTMKPTIHGEAKNNPAASSRP